MEHNIIMGTENQFCPHSSTNDKENISNYIQADIGSNFNLVVPTVHSIRYRGPNLSKSRTDIKTEHINRKSVQKIFNAYDFAEYQNWPINYFVVIHLKDEVRQSANTCFTAIRHKYSDCYNYFRGKTECHIPPTYVYSFENPNNNIHVNWCLHIPDGFESTFLNKVDGWVSKVQGKLAPNTIDVTKLNPGCYKSTANYILKGVDPEYADCFHLSVLQDRKGPQGLIYGKRAGFSQSIGVTAQRKAEFNPTQHRRQRMQERRPT